MVRVESSQEGKYTDKQGEMEKWWGIQKSDRFLFTGVIAITARGGGRRCDSDTGDRRKKDFWRPFLTPFRRIKRKHTKTKNVLLGRRKSLLKLFSLLKLAKFCPMAWTGILKAPLLVFFGKNKGSTKNVFSGRRKSFL